MIVYYFRISSSSSLLFTVINKQSDPSRLQNMTVRPV